MISDSPKISIIVPCYRTERWLDRCVTSLVNQTLQDIEIILVDDGSPDRVPAICDEWAAKDARVKVIHQRNAGQGPALNAGLDIAKGEYVAFVDSDDWIDNDAYRAAYKEVERDAGIDVVFFGWSIENRWGRWKQHTVREKTQWKDTAVRTFLLDRLACAPLCRTNGPDLSGIEDERIYVTHSIYRRKLVEAYRIRFSTARVQLDLLWETEFLLRCNNIVWIPACYYHYCCNGASVTNTFNVGNYNAFGNVCRTLTSLDSDLLYLQRIDRAFIDNTRMYILSLVASGYPYKIQQLRCILKDSVWTEIRKRYRTSWLPLYPRVVLYLTLSRHPRLLYLWAKLANSAKYLLRK